MKRKITEISVYEFFMCMFVILNHLLSEGAAVLPKWSFLSVLFYSITKLTTFVVAGFVFSSAIKLFYQFRDKNQFSYFRFLWGRVKKIIIPYLIACCLYYAVYVFGFHYYPFDLDEFLGFVLSSNLSAQFYFVILMVQFYLLMPLWLQLFRPKNKAYGILLVILSFLLTILCRRFYPYPNAISKVFPSYLVFWVAGSYVGLNYETFETLISQNKIAVNLCWFVVAIAHCILSYLEFAGTISYDFAPLLVVFFCFFSMFGFYSYAREVTFSLQRRAKGLLISISQASYDIYLIHCLIITSVHQILTDCNIEGFFPRFFITFFITYGISIIFSVLKATLFANWKAKRMRASAIRARKMARRKRYL